MTIIIRSDFGKLYPQIFLDDALYELCIQKMLEHDIIYISEGIDCMSYVYKKC